MKGPVIPVTLVLVAASVVGAAQDSANQLTSLGIRKLAYEVPHVLNVGGAGINSYSLGTGGTLYKTYSTDGGITSLVGGDIYVIDSPDGKPRKLVSGGSHPAWSPDGSQVAYCSWKGLGFGQIEIVNSDGTGQRELTNMKGGACFPDWSPDGTKIAFTALSPGDKEKSLMDAVHTEIFVIDANGGDLVAVTPGYAARWSPGGKLLILLRRSEEKGADGAIWLSTPDGKQTKMVAVSDRPMEGATWLSSGRGILASYMRDGTYSVFRSYLDGSQARGAQPEKLCGHPKSEWSWPEMSPDGKRLLAVVEGCASDKHGEVPSGSVCLTRRVVSLDLESNQEVTLARGTSYSVVWDKQ